MRKRLKEIYDHSTLVAKIRYSYLCLLVPFVLFLIFCFYNLWNNNRRYEDMVNSSVMASQFSLDFQKDFDYETYLLIVGNKTLEESSLHAMLEEADEIVAGLEELTESQENRKRLTSRSSLTSRLTRRRKFNASNAAFPARAGPRAGFFFKKTKNPLAICEKKTTIRLSNIAGSRNKRVKYRSDGRLPPGEGEVSPRCCFRNRQARPRRFGGYWKSTYRNLLPHSI